MSGRTSTLRTEAVVVGAGIAGLTAALRLAPMRVVVLGAAPLGEAAASAWAQGGVSAALDAADSPEIHAADTLAVAGGIADLAIAAGVTAEAQARIEELGALGVRFDRTGDGKLRLGREGGHSRHRIVHAIGDGTGGEIMRVLTAAARASEHITLLDGALARSLLAPGAVVGVLVERGGETVQLLADSVVLATGGIGGIYRFTSNPLTARGLGLALAARAGAVLSDLEFVQFHPTALDVGRDPMPLVTEALRGEGAVLLDAAGQRFMPALHELAELAPRDVVARAVARHRASGRVFLDARAALGESFPQRFPTVFTACQAAGLDPRTTPIPIAPAAHYHMGGVSTDGVGRSSLAGLWAVGEVAATGLHGANRLASNSLLEALVFATRAAHDIKGRTPASARPTPVTPAMTAGAVETPAFARVRTLMTEAIGVEREEHTMRRALAELRGLRAEIEPVSWPQCAATLVAELVATAALRRRESRGAHFRADHPAAQPALARRSYLTLAEVGTDIDAEAGVPRRKATP
ncbi:MAG: L-aspartate oxidase [Rhodospirillaceae bacterium]|nr:L-aspartate oxidase [Rhodospirillaceae bacterium]